MNDLQNLGNEKMPSVLKNPFNVTKIKRIYVSFSEAFSKWTAYGSVSFQNGNTEGEQKFNGESFDNVVFQIKEFINELQENENSDATTN